MSDSKAETTHGGMTGSQWLRMAIELGPLVVFFLLNSRADAIFGNAESQNIFYATGGFMVATAISLIYSQVKFRKIPTMPLVTGIFVMIFGALTIWLQDEQFIKVKPTIVNALFATALLGAAAMGKPIMKQLFDGAFNLTDKGWMVLTVRWGLFFVFLGVINEVVWRNFSTDFWVSFKLFGVMPLTMIFGIAQIPVLTKHAPKNETEAAE
ncbi:septation protein A [Parvibaculum sp.]|jgi:intracellular septation protein|uniref:septation protein A n=1 Tax=Parvibaculum sp. TaxID=2024848 RepID=UPI000C455BF6|nr:septation protein A [Parvibaculum sp.]HAC57975.1 septation protein A [Rhodobiaceae bacterium]MAU61060.1 septation protein A [Parvibaculum sp.]MBO6668544.1 septation protein A [Parvibaculum sp.]MBO6691136.1 septation protein A [Parvibaculum sp.]MBO6714220.1 septation protein A [Parvibaculum sp.]|tara:strand:+ start:8560 stop:9189 length:630 start_codon:yes stop_codon:yes gene_type:complete